VIGLKFPAYLIPHPSKSLWMVHQHRDAYELWDNEIGALNWHERGREIRNLIRETDSRILNDEFGAKYAISKNVADRARHNNQVDLEPLYHPPLSAGEFYCGKNEPYILFPSRLSSIKRQYLVIEAMSHVGSPGKLVLAGKPDSDAYIDELKGLAERHGVSDRVEFTGYLDEERKRQLMADARAIAFTPYDEDYGYITLEAMLAGKPLVTCRDSGGVLEFVDDQVNGAVCRSSAAEIGAEIERMLAHPNRAREMGAAGRDKYDRMEISWANVVEKLTA
jgi:glycosyltransferase involved in cell wall biosynthesis